MTPYERALKLIDDCLVYYCKQGNPLGWDAGNQSCIYDNGNGGRCAIGFALHQIGEMTVGIGLFNGDVQDLVDCGNVDVPAILDLPLPFLSAFQDAHDVSCVTSNPKAVLLSRMLWLKDTLLEDPFSFTFHGGYYNA